MSQEWMDKMARLTTDKERALASGREQAERSAADQTRAPQTVALLEQLVAEQARQTGLLEQILAALQGPTSRA